MQWKVSIGMEQPRFRRQLYVEEESWWLQDDHFGWLPAGQCDRQILRWHRLRHVSVFPPPFVCLRWRLPWPALRGYHPLREFQTASSAGHSGFLRVNNVTTSTSITTVPSQSSWTIYCFLLIYCKKRKIQKRLSTWGLEL